MTQQEFEDTLRQFLRREPFQPFVVELLDGTTIDIDERAVSFDDGEAAFLTATDELIIFRYGDVLAIRAAHGVPT